MTYQDIVNIIRNAANYVNSNGYFIHGRKTDGSLQYDESFPQIILLEPTPNTAINNNTFVETISFPIIFVAQDTPETTELRREEIKQDMYLLSRKLLAKIDENELLQNVSYAGGQPEIRQMAGTLTGFSYTLEITYPLSECTLDFDLPPTIQLFATQTNVNAGTEIQIGWIANNVNSVVITPFGTLQGQFGFITTTINADTTFVGTATNAIGTATDTIEITVGNGCDDATAVLKDTDGNVISTTNIPSGDSDDIIAPDATILINGDSSFPTIPSGGSENIMVENTNGGAVGAYDGNSNSWVIADSQVTVENSNQTFQTVVNVVAEGSAVEVLPGTTIEVNGNNEGSVVSVQTVDIQLTDGVNPVVPQNVNIIGNAVEIEVAAASGWQRPSDWLPMPTIATGEQVFYGLFAVYNVEGGNRVAFFFQGNYTVDWGDGSPLQNVISGVKAEHQYNYADVANTTSEGWRQALIKVTPTGAANLTVVNLNQTFTGIAAGKTSQFMDIVMNVPNCTNLVALGNGNIFHRAVERVWIKEIGVITTTQDLFFGCRSLQNVPLFDTSSVTNMQNMFRDCNSIEEIPLFNTGSVANMASMFFNCNSLITVPLFNTASVTTMSAMFQNCTSLQTVPLFNTAIVANMTSMFNGCFALQRVPLFNTAIVTNMSSMFINCLSLQTTPAFNSASVTTMQDMFFANQSLFLVSLNMTSVTVTTSMFTAQSLQQFTATGLTRGISIANNLLSATELNNFFTSLGTAAGAQLVQVQGNPGASTCNTAIATAKGFTVQII